MSGSGLGDHGVSGSGLARLRALLREQGGLIASLLADDRPLASGSGLAGRARWSPAPIVAAGPRARARREEYELLVESIYEGYLLHYGSPRVLAPPEADLGLLVGDRLYALGLARLVRLGDTEAVAELADTITLASLAHATDKQDLAGAVWAAGAHAVGWGPSEAHIHAKRLAFAGAPEAIEAMRTSSAGVADGLPTSS